MSARDKQSLSLGGALQTTFGGSGQTDFGAPTIDGQAAAVCMCLHQRWRMGCHPRNELVAILVTIYFLPVGT
jgi:microcystin-dependent protein